jgi:Ser-tRNA(Ala) deacylase AlaX
MVITATLGRVPDMHMFGACAGHDRGAGPMPTTLLYLEDAQRYEADATVVRVFRSDDLDVVILNETIFYPQGGGQPADCGELRTPGGVMRVRRASFVDGDVHHAGPIAEGSIEPGERAHLSIDVDLRKTYAVLHTSGHLVMTAVDRLVGYHPIKGYHFPNGPYVEFDGALPEDSRDTFAKEVQEVVDSMVAENSEVTSRLATIEDLRTQGVYIPAEIPAGKPTRVVITAGYQSPCGGTHVRRLGELTELRIRGVKVGSGRTRVGYLCNLVD